jgi:predicted lipid-binding transport protein (Tim44 family)
VLQRPGRARRQSRFYEQIFKISSLFIKTEFAYALSIAIHRAAGVAEFAPGAFEEENMKKLMMAMMVAVVALTVGVTSAEAKRLGGGSSFGKQSQSASRQAAPQSPQSANTAKPATPPAAAPASPWRGILGGALLGLGLGALLSHFGMGGALASVISTVLMVALLGLAAMFIYRMLRSRTAPSEGRPAWAGASPAASTAALPEIGSRVGGAAPMQGTALQDDTASAPWGVPADFDSAGFLRHAKTYFIRLQAAWDKAEVNDIREFTTPEMFAEIRLQIQERGASANHTDVVTLDAVLLGIETVGGEHLASVRFSGTIKEEERAPAAPFTEIWNLAKPVNGSGGWLLAGIQQVS